MFRTQTNPFDDVIAKATDENLTAVNWEYMMDAWEKVNSEGETGPKDAVAALIKRLAHRNANVQLYTLELANAFTQNCGHKMQQEMASRAFTDALLRLASDRTTHQTVKSSVLEKMQEWSQMFSTDPQLGIMEQAYNRLKSQNPNLHPPSKPTKREITDQDRQKEEEELQMALEISLRERAGSSAAKASTPGSSSQHPAASSASPAAAAAAAALQPAPPAQTTAATVSRVRALYDFVPSEAGELAFRKGDIIAVLESVYKDWWKGSLRGQTGIFPLNYVEKLADPTVEELQRDAQMEAEVFGQIKNVEKLLAMLSTSEGTQGQDNDEITNLYHSTLAIRPKLIELIGKYSQKKDDFVALNEKFIKARRDYETLLESSMSQGASIHYPGARPPASTQYSYPPPASSASSYPTGPSAASPAHQHSAYQPPPGRGRTPSNSYYPPTGPADHASSPHSPNPSHATYYAVGGAPPGQGPSQPPGDHHQQQPQELATESYNTPVEQTKPYQAYPGAGPQGANLGGPSGPGYQPYQRSTSGQYPPSTSPGPGASASALPYPTGRNSYQGPPAGNTFYPPQPSQPGGGNEESYYR